MSYCRWSSDSFQCDLYVYRDVEGGWSIHVAKSRRVFHSPIPPPPPEGDFKATFEHMEAIIRLLRDATIVPIGLPYDGKDFRGERDSTVATLRMLKEAGYRFPYKIIEEIAAEEENAPYIDPPHRCADCGSTVEHDPGCPQVGGQ